MRIVDWLKSIFKKEAVKTPNVEVRYLFDESTKDLLNKKGKTVISDMADVIVKNKGLVIGRGLGVVSGFYLNKDENDYVSASIIDLELISDEYELNLNDSFDVQYNAIAYDDETKTVKSDISIVLEDAKFLNNENVICHKSRTKIIETERA